MAKSHDEIILDALLKAMKDLPALRPLTGTAKVEALFTTKQAALAKRAIEEGWLTTHKQSVKSGRTTKTVELALLTEAGVRKVADAAHPGNLEEILRSLKSAVEKVGAPTATPDPEAFREAVEKATAACVGAINSACTSLREEVLKALPSGGPVISPGPILDAIAGALGKLKPVEVRIPVVTQPEPAAPAPAPEPNKSEPAKRDSVASVAEDIVAFVNATARERSVGCDFVELFEHLRTKHPTLSIGTFHDALRAMDDAGRIRLKDWPRLQDDIPRPELALFVSHTVMYHAQPAH